MPWIGLLFVAALVFWLAVNFYKTPADFVSIALEGLTLGLVYGLIALGYSLVYGILELINFAHGDVFMLGSWVVVGFGVHRLGLDEASSGFTVVWGRWSHLARRHGLLRPAERIDRACCLPPVA